MKLHKVPIYHLSKIQLINWFSDFILKLNNIVLHIPPETVNKSLKTQTLDEAIALFKFGNLWILLLMQSNDSHKLLNYKLSIYPPIKYN